VLTRIRRKERFIMSRWLIVVIVILAVLVLLPLLARVLTEEDVATAVPEGREGGEFSMRP
jgi:hypothetical protein